MSVTADFLSAVKATKLAFKSYLLTENQTYIAFEFQRTNREELYSAREPVLKTEDLHNVQYNPIETLGSEDPISRPKGPPLLLLANQATMYGTAECSL